MFDEGVRLLGVSRPFGKVFDEEGGENHEIGYTDIDGSWVVYEPTHFICSIFKVENGTTFINLPRNFLSQKPPDYLYYCIDEKKHELYLSFIEPQPEIPSYPRALQKAGKNNCQIRLPFPRELKGIFFPDKYQRMTLTEIEKDLFKCKFEWEKLEPTKYNKTQNFYDGD